MSTVCHKLLYIFEESSLYSLKLSLVLSTYVLYISLMQSVKGA